VRTTIIGSLPAGVSVEVDGVGVLD
jgi:hypothetical protein